MKKHNFQNGQSRNNLEGDYVITHSFAGKLYGKRVPKITNKSYKLITSNFSNFINYTHNYFMHRVAELTVET